jgi:predicted Zn finger-like uncharacterized protein
MSTGIVMLLVCPSCETSFRLASEALGAEGRNVRCARCHTIWFADPAQLAPDPETGGHEISIFPAGEIINVPALITDDATVAESPAYTREETAETISAKGSPAPGKRKPSAWRKLSWRGRDKKSGPGLGLVLTTCTLAMIVTAAIVSPATVVRAMPDLAGLYAAAGRPVNLRGLEFREVRTMRETHDGIALLVTEGKIANISGRDLELPPVRLAAVGANGQELYAWTAAPSRGTLADGETLAFKSRLASPPAEARHVQVRFLGKSDLAWGYR